MTREEATQIMSTWLVSSKGTKGQRGYIEGWFDEEDAEAFRMAIEALSVAVSREDTVTLNSPISIQTDMVAVVRCKDCKYYNNDYMGEWCGRHQAPVWVKEADFCSWARMKGDIE